jgi:hypothetical protein
VRAAGGAEAVDRLQLVANDAEAAVAAAARFDDLDLQLVDVLVLVDEHVGTGRRGHLRATTAR